MKSPLCTLMALFLIPGGSLGSGTDESSEEPAWLKGLYIKPLPLAPPQEGPVEENETTIDFEGNITMCNFSPNRGDVPFRSLGNPAVWNYWSTDLQAGREVSITVNRISCGMDPAFYLFFNTGVIVGSGDDELPPPPVCNSTEFFNDPQLNISALPFTGQYVVGVFDNAGEPLDEEEEGAYNISIGSPDRDGDGIGEACDRCPFTDLSKNIVVQDCDTGIQDILVTIDGCSIGDLLPGILKKCDRREINKLAKGKDYDFLECVNNRLRMLRTNTVDDSYTWGVQRDIMECVEGVDRKEVRMTCGNRFYASDKNNLFIVDPASGGRQFVGRLPTCSAEISFDDKKGVVLNSRCGGNVITEVEPSDAGLIDTSRPFPKGPISGLTLIGGVLFGTHVQRKTQPRISRLVTLDRKTSEFKVIGETGKEAVPGLAFDQREGKLWGVTGGNSPAELLTLNMFTGQAEVMANVTIEMDNGVETKEFSINNLGSLDFGPDGELYAGVNERASVMPKSLIKINRQNGKSQLVGESDVGYRGLACYTIEPF